MRNRAGAAHCASVFAHAGRTMMEACHKQMELMVSAFNRATKRFCAGFLIVGS